LQSRSSIACFWAVRLSAGAELDRSFQALRTRCSRFNTDFP